MIQQDSVQATIDRWLKAFVDSDVEQIVGMYAPEATFTGTSSARFMQSRDQIRAYFRAVLQDRQPASAEVLDHEVQLYGDMAIVTALDRIEWSDPGSPAASMGRVTFVLEL